MKGDGEMNGDYNNYGVDENIVEDSNQNNWRFYEVVFARSMDIIWGYSTTDKI